MTNANSAWNYNNAPLERNLPQDYTLPKPSKAITEICDYNRKS